MENYSITIGKSKLKEYRRGYFTAGLYIGAIITLIMVMLFSCCESYADDYHLQWDANTESDLAGYKLYYKVDGPGPPYDGGVIDVGNVTDYVWQGLPGRDDLAPGQRIRFVCTAYNILGWESGYSNEPSVGVPANPTLRLVGVSSQ